MSLSIHEIHIVKAGPERIADLEPFWQALFAHYEALKPSHLEAPALPPDESWARRRRMYETQISESGSFILFAEYQNSPVGCAVVSIGEGSTMWGDTNACLELLVVLPEVRQRGIGTALMHAVFKELRLCNIGDLHLSTLCTDTYPPRFYHRFGLYPLMLTLRGSVPLE